MIATHVRLTKYLEEIAKLKRELDVLEMRTECIYNQKSLNEWKGRTIQSTRRFHRWRHRTRNWRRILHRCKKSWNTRRRHDIVIKSCCRKRVMISWCNSARNTMRRSRMCGRRRSDVMKADCSWSNTSALIRRGLTKASTHRWGGLIRWRISMYSTPRRHQVGERKRKRVLAI